MAVVPMIMDKTKAMMVNQFVLPAACSASSVGLYKLFQLAFDIKPQ